MNKVCPISYNVVNEQQTKINAIIVSFVLLLFILTSYNVLIAFLAIDFFVRGFFQNKKRSLINAVSFSIIDKFSLSGKKINAGPKIFAAKLGFIFSISAFSFSLIGLNVLALYFSIVFFICAFLEASVGYCVACKLYPYYKALISKKQKNSI